MNTKLTKEAGAMALACLSLHSAAAAGILTGTGADAAGLLPTLDSFRAGIGGVNNGANNALGTEVTGGRREINWDAGALPEAMPPDFFNRSVDFNGSAGSRRGAVFSTPGTGLLVSANTADATARFGNLDPAYNTAFTVNSAQRLFAAEGSTEVWMTFALPNDPTTAAAVTAFGAVFTDVDIANLTRIDLYDAGNTLLASAHAPVQDGGLSFVGITLGAGQFAASVKITSGNLALGAGNLDGSGLDVVAMDDFIYSEPLALSAVPEPQAWAGVAGGLCLLAGWRLRRGAAGSRR